MTIEEIIENHVCRFNDAPQRCECYIAGLKEILEGVVEREKSQLEKWRFEGITTYYNDAKHDTINHLESIINKLN